MNLPDFLTDWHSPSPTLIVHTSGSTGTPKQMVVEKQRMLASARITCDFLGLKPNDTALLCLPLDYIAGKMMVVRSIERNLRLTTVEPSNYPLQTLVHTPHSTDLTPSTLVLSPSSFDLSPSTLVLSPSSFDLRPSTFDLRPSTSVLSPSSSDLSPSSFDLRPSSFVLIAMVPSQVFATLQVPEEAELLKNTEHLIIGGGAITKELQEQLRDFPNNVWSTYGMTETLSHIALRKLNGPDASEWYTPFNEVEISLTPDNCLQIHAPQVNPDILITNDIAELNPDNPRQFRILGRKDNIICSGGIKLQIEQIEEALSPLIKVPFAIAKRPDPQYGEVPILILENLENLEDLEYLEPLENLKNLPKYAIPKQIIRIEKIPMTETGKINRAKLNAIIES